MDRPTDKSSAPAEAKPVMVRVAWTLLGLVAVGVGGIGIVVPGLPSTVFFIMAAWAFSKSNPRLEAWVLGLPQVGSLVQDYRAGLGMPRRAKTTAAVMIVVFVGLSAWLVDNLVFRAVLLAAGVVGLWVVLARVPTKDPELERA